MNRTEKEELVAFYTDVFEQAGSVVVAHYAGLNVAQLSGLRKALQAEGGQLKVAKNRLVKRVLAQKHEAAMTLFTGPTALIWSQDPMDAPKITADFAKTHENLVIIGGIMDDKILDEGDVKNLASLPSLDGLRSILIGLINSPATKIAQIAQEPARQLARLMDAKTE